MASSSESPSIRPFQFDGDVNGMLQKSVNLYRGRITIPFQLISLTGRNGMSVALSALYTGITEEEATAWNMTAPTGVLGLGWTLPLEQVIAVPGGTVAPEDTTYFLATGGNRNRLIPTQNPNEFVVQDYQFWSVKFDHLASTWTVIHENGDTYLYGGDEAYIETGVCWEDWAGSSIQTDAKTYPTAWNLHSVTNTWGDQISLAYEYDQVPIGGNEASYTRASRLVQMTDAFGRHVTLNYEFKTETEQIREIQPQHVNPSGALEEAYQEPIEEKYLASIDVQDYLGAPFFTVLIESSTQNFSTEESPYLYKRCINRIRTQYVGAAPEAGMQFKYVPAGQLAAGSLSQIQTPTGSTITYNYGQVALEDAPTIVDVDYNAGDPRVWFGSDYVVMTFQEGSDLQVEIYDWSGGWSKVPIASIGAAGKIEDLRVVTQAGYFAIYYSGVAQGTANGTIFIRNPFLPDSWSPYAISGTVERIVCGANFFLVHLVGSTLLRPYRVTTTSIVPESTVDAGSSDLALAATGNSFVLFACNKTAKTGNVSLISRSPNGTWIRTQVHTLSNVYWDDWVSNAFWSAAGAWAAATYIDADETNYHLCVMSWARSISSPTWTELGFYPVPTSGSLPFAVSAAVGNQIANLGHLFRFDGNDWISTELPTPGDSDKVAARYVYGDDLAMVSRLQNGQSVYSLATYDAYADRWNASRSLGSGSAASDGPYAPTAGADYLTVANSVYFRGAKSDWTHIGGAALGSSVNLASVKNRAPAYILSEDTAGQNSSLVVLKNGTFIPVQGQPYLTLYNRRCYVPGDKGSEAPGTILAGEGAFVTYTGTFGPGCGLTLYRVGDALLAPTQPYALAVVVRSASVFDGVRTRLTSYNYNEQPIGEYLPLESEARLTAHSEASSDKGGTPMARGATYDTSGQIPEFSKVSVIEGDLVQNGASVKYFLNGVAPRLRSVFYPPDNAFSNARAYATLMNGVLVGEVAIDGQGMPAAISLTSWQASIVNEPLGPASYTRQRRMITATPCVPLGDCSAQKADVDDLNAGRVPPVVAQAISNAGAPLGSDVEVLAIEQDEFWIVLDDTNDRAFPITNDGGKKTLTIFWSVRATSTIDYNAKNGLPSLQGATNVDTDGVSQQKLTEQLYLCDVLPDVASKHHLLSASVQSTASSISGEDSIQRFTEAQVSRFWSWAPASTGTALAPTSTLQVDLPPGVLESYVWKNASAWSTDRPTFTAWNGGVPDSNVWLLQSEATLRTLHGQVLERTSIDGVPSSYVWDAKETQTIAKFNNASVSNSEATYFAFEPNEPNPGWVHAVAYSGDSHTGSQCGVVASGASPLSCTFAPKKSQAYFFGCWAKTRPGFAGEAQWRFINHADGQPVAAPIDIPDTGGQWTLLYRLVDLSGRPASTSIEISCLNQGGADVLIDNLRFSPLLSAMDAGSIDPASGSLTAKLDTNAATGFALIDYAQRAIGMAGPGDAGSWQTGYMWPSCTDTFDPTRPNSALSVASKSPALYGRFMPDTWQSYFSSPAPEKWKVTNGNLTLIESAAAELVLKKDLPAGAFGLRVQVTPPASLSAAITLTFTGESGKFVSLALAPGGDSGMWRLTDDQGHGPASVKNPRSGIVEWAVIASGSSFIFFVAGQRIFSYVADQPVSGTLSLQVSQAGTAFKDLLVASEPVVSLQFVNGDGQPTQSHKLHGNESFVTEVLYDSVGRGHLSTKTAPLSAQQSAPLSYRDGFAIYDPASATMTGDVAQYYSPANPDAPSHDDGYPFTRTRYDDTTLDRVIEVGLPGSAHAITNGNTGHTSKSRYTLNLSDALTAKMNLPLAQYQVLRQWSADNLETFQAQDKAQDVVAQGAVLETGKLSLTGSYFDAAGNLIRSLTPNAYDPPAGSTAAQFETSSTYDSLHTITQTASEELITDSIRDQAGRLRFMQDPRGRAEGYYCYWTYDGVRRNIESGYVTGNWDPAALKAKAANLPLLSGQPDWPTPDTAGANWSSRLFYDGDGTHSYQIGRLVSAQVSDGETTGVAVSERYIYNAGGKVAEASTEWPSAAQALQTFAYVYDAAGNLISTKGESVDTVLSYDECGRLTAVGSSVARDAYASYSYYPSNAIQTEALNGGRVLIPRRYNSVWQPIARGDSSSPLREDLGFDTRADGGAGYFDGRIASANYGYVGTQPPPAFGCEYDYDGVGQITASKCTIPDWSLGAASPVSYDLNGNLLVAPTSAGIDKYQNDGNVLETFTPGSGASEAFAYDPNKAVIGCQGTGLALTYDRCTLLATSASRGGGAKESYVAGPTRALSIETVQAAGKTSRRFICYGVDGNPLIETRVSEAGTERVIYVQGPIGLVAIQADATYFVVRDHLGSNRVVLDGTNAVVAGYDYLPFGGMARTYGAMPDLLVYRFTGQRWSEGVGLYNYGARLYDPGLRRFLSRDPALQFASPYVYVGNNPISFIDPSGAFSWQALVGGIVGALEIIAGVLLDVLVDVGTGGAATALDTFIGGLIGAGAQALAYSITAGDDFDWVQYAEQQGIGAAIGVLTAGIGAFASWAGEGVTNAAEAAGRSALWGSFTENGINIVAGGGITGLVGQGLQDWATGQTPGSDLGTAFIFGAVGGAIGIGTGKLTNKVSDSLPLPGRGLSAADRPRTGGWILARAVVGGSASAATAYVIQGFSNLVGGKDWNTDWDGAVSLGFALGMVPAIPRRSDTAYRRLGTRAAEPRQIEMQSMS